MQWASLGLRSYVWELLPVMDAVTSMPINLNKRHSCCGKLFLNAYNLLVSHRILNFEYPKQLVSNVVRIQDKIVVIFYNTCTSISKNFLTKARHTRCFKHLRKPPLTNQSTCHISDNKTYMKKDLL